MVGRPLALDKNYLRNFSYIRVKIGCQDLSLVPSTRIGEIRKAFFEFQFTRELPEGNQQPNNQVGNLWPIRRMRINKGPQNVRELVRLTMALALHLQGCQIVLIIKWEDKEMLLTLLLLQKGD
jgi:hypothetical protein